MERVPKKNTRRYLLGDEFLPVVKNSVPRIRPAVIAKDVRIFARFGEKVSYLPFSGISVLKINDDVSNDTHIGA